MCGIFGIISTKNVLKKRELLLLINKLFVLSESRGKESSGIAVKTADPNKIHVLKKSLPASDFINHDEYNSFIQSVFDKKKFLSKKISPISVIAHARLVTNGTKDDNKNNQPVIKDNCVMVHNGIITNTDFLWKKHKTIKKNFEVDTELLAGLFMNNLKESSSFVDAARISFNEIEGTATTAILFSEYSSLLLATNNASLYYLFNSSLGLFIFASEEFILKKTIQSLNIKKKYDLKEIVRASPNQGILIETLSSEIKIFDLKTNENLNDLTLNAKSEASEIIDYSVNKHVETLEPHNILSSQKLLLFENEFYKNSNRIGIIQRCKKCLLPITFPYIKLNKNGICNYCNSYKSVTPQPLKEEEFKQILNTFNIPDGKPNCIVPFSGGRDSSYGIHYIVNELKLRPITFTYDWGMVTDLARRNIARVCGKLGIENILVSANISQKRKYIRKNVEAWLKRPDLGMIPLFMAGDKQFFYYVNKIKKQTGIPIDIWMGNKLEDTNFKIGFAKVAPCFNKDRIDQLTFFQKGKIAFFYLKNFILNYRYINSSLLDTIWAFYSYYSEPRINYYLLFDYIPWNEEIIKKTLITEYNWETDPETKSTWRIGDGTAAFYNYIYYTIAGFTENDTFRSNQIREGMISREEALIKVNEENKPRWKAIKWYCDTIGIDFENTIKQINQVKKLY